jgi:hypothetical protein
MFIFQYEKGMMKIKLFYLLIVLFGIPFCSNAGQSGEKDSIEFITYSMDSSFFSCKVPSSWYLKRDKDEDEEYRIYEIMLFAPESDKASVEVDVSYFAGDNEDFNGYADYIERNSKNVIGETKNSRETYEPVKKIVLNERNGFELSSERAVYLNPTTKSDESVELKEKIYVLPAKDGFYVLHFTAPKTLFPKYLPVFEFISLSFNGRL